MFSPVWDLERLAYQRRLNLMKWIILECPKYLSGANFMKQIMKWRPLHETNIKVAPPT